MNAKIEAIHCKMSYSWQTMPFESCKQSFCNKYRNGSLNKKYHFFLKKDNLPKVPQAPAIEYFQSYSKRMVYDNAWEARNEQQLIARCRSAKILLRSVSDQFFSRSFFIWCGFRCSWLCSLHIYLWFWDSTYNFGFFEPCSAFSVELMMFSNEYFISTEKTGYVTTFRRWINII